ncbi:hypothetical protein C900_05352 [Fulvivirga imtechensis AK7]|uniref:Uncharacterized protein n=1 Tax=Fulvivirga imtechensis AK7 TaxID=1237149 RepID=L8JJS1_9BACT|nr:hypothetical protein [Fulvivirga imtechensis]ELR69156.1 hypothetical protein C900_05352 [Fulvivirga imtechensis AK7]
MNLALTAYDPCGAALGTFTPEGDCLEEGSLIVGAMMIKKGVDVQTLIDAVTIDAAVAAGDVKILKGFSGNWARPTANKKPGMAFKREKTSSFTYSIPFKHYGVDANLAFWNTVNFSNDWSMAFVFEDFKMFGALDDQLAVIPMDFDVAPASDEELGGSRRMEGTANWTVKAMPYLLSDTPAAVLATYFK